MSAPSHSDDPADASATAGISDQDAKTTVPGVVTRDFAASGDNVAISAVNQSPKKSKAGNGTNFEGGDALGRKRSIAFQDDTDGEDAPETDGVRRRRPPQRSMTAETGMSTLTDASSDTDTDTDTDTLSEDGRYRPSFLPGHLLNRLRRSQAEENGDENASEAAPAIEVLRYRRMPILSGALAPFSIMLEVPGLTTKWYVRHGPSGSPVEYRDNPVVLEVGLAFSIAAAVLANVFLLCRFTSILPPRRGTGSAILCLLIHDAINIAALVAFGVIHAVDDGFTYSQAYWMTLAATAASIACTLTLILDYLGTRNYKSAGSGLTPKQTQLVIVIMILLVYLSLGSLMYSLLLDIAFQAALYFTCTTLLTVGLGDIVPQTTASRIVFFIWAPIGIIMFAATVVIARGTILEEFENSYRRRREEFRNRLKSKRTEMRKNRREWRRLRRLSKLQRRVTGRVGEGNGGDAVASKDVAPTDGANGHVHAWSWHSLRSFLPGRRHRHDSTRSTEAGLRPFSPSADQPYLEQRNGDAAKAIPNGSPLTAEKAGAEQDASQAISTGPPSSELSDVECMLASQRSQLEDGWTEFRADLSHREKTEFWSKIFVSAFLFVAFWLIGSVVFHYTEDWTFFQAFYFCFVLFSTIGFGDFAPRSDAGRSFFIIWALMGVGVLTILLSVFSDAWSSLFTDKLAKTREKIKRKGRSLRNKVVHKRGHTLKHEDARSSSPTASAVSIPSPVAQPAAVTDLSADETRPHRSPVSTSFVLPSAAKANGSSDTTIIGTSEGKSEEQTYSNDLAERQEANTSQSSPPSSHSDPALKLAHSALELHRAAFSHVASNRVELLSSLRNAGNIKEMLPKHLFADKSDNGGGPSSPLVDTSHHHLSFFRRHHSEREAPADATQAAAPSDSVFHPDLFPALRSLSSKAELHEVDPETDFDLDPPAGSSARKAARQLLTFLELEESIRGMFGDVDSLRREMDALRRENEELRQASKGVDNGERDDNPADRRGT